MKEELRPFYSDKEQTTSVILNGDGFDPAQFPAMLKTYILNQWNRQMANDDGKIEAHEIEILDYAYQKAEPSKYMVTIRWKFI